MARELSEIKKQMTDDFVANQTIQERYALDTTKTFEQQFSKVSIENILFNVVAFAMWLLEKIWDQFRNETNTEIEKNRIHSKQWYRQKALDFLFGFAVADGTDAFDTTGATDEEIQAAKVVKQAACIKMISSAGYGILRVKVAGEDANGNLKRLPTDQFDALKYYFMRYAVDAGTQLKCTTGDADDLLLNIDVYYDPLVLNTQGERLDGTAQTPVKDAIVAFLKSIEFNGSLYVSDLVLKIREVEGVSKCKCVEARSKYGSYSYNTTGIQNVGLIDEIRIADAGYMKLDESVLQINYKVMPE